METFERLGTRIADDAEMLSICARYPNIGLIRRGGILRPYYFEQSTDRSSNRMIICPTINGTITTVMLITFCEWS